MLQHAVSKLACLMLSPVRSCRSSICPDRHSTAWLVSLVVFSCHMVSKWWHGTCIGRIWGGWYALPRTISLFSHCWLYLRLVSSPWPRCWSFYLCMWCWAYFFPCWSVRPQDYSTPFVIAGSTQELYTCLFKPMARLLLKISRCLAYATQHDMILRCISLSWISSLRL